MTLDLTKVPDDILKLFVEWRNDKVERENEQLREAQRR